MHKYYIIYAKDDAKRKFEALMPCGKTTSKLFYAAVFAEDKLVHALTEAKKYYTFVQARYNHSR